MPGTGDTKVMDWVEQQALGDGIESIASDVNKSICQPQIPNLNGRVYDIQTLLDMCSTVDLSHIHLRIHHGALHGMCRNFYFQPLFYANMLLRLSNPVLLWLSYDSFALSAIPVLESSIEIKTNISLA